MSTPGRSVIAGRGPVVASGAGRTGVDWLAERFVKDVVAISRLTGLGIKFGPDILEDGFFVAEILAGLAIELPQDSVFADREQPVLSVPVDQNAFEYDIEIKRFTRRMLEVPFKFPVIRIDRNRRIGVEAIAFRAASERHPGLGLSGSPDRSS